MLRRFLVFGLVCILIVLSLWGYAQWQPEHYAQLKSSLIRKVNNKSSDVKQDNSEISRESREPYEENASPSFSAPQPSDSRSLHSDKQPNAETQATEISSEQAPSDPVNEPEKMMIPTWDVIRIDPDGTGTLAGRAAPGASVTLLQNGKAVANTQVNGAGEWVIILDQPLEKGESALTLLARLPKAEDNKPPVEGKQTVALSLPQKQGDAFLVSVLEPDQPIAILAQKGSVSNEATEPDNARAFEEAQQTKQNIKESRSEGDILPEALDASQLKTVENEYDTDNKFTKANATVPAEDTLSAAEKTEPAERGQAALPSSPRITAVEIEDDRLYIAGTSKPEATLKLYLNDTLEREFQAGPEGAWLFSRDNAPDPGEYAIRLDVMGADGQSVDNRAEVMFRHEWDEKIASSGTPASTPPVSKGNDAKASEQDASDLSENSPQMANTPSDVPQGQNGAPEQRRPVLQANDPQAVIIRRRDNLWTLSKRVYGKGQRYAVIYDANSDQIRDPDLIYPGQVFTLPDAKDEWGKVPGPQALEQERLVAPSRP
jgi:nucleoid-associated protein YgaU